jgi:hypothetical protein
MVQCFGRWRRKDIRNTRKCALIGLLLFTTTLQLATAFTPKPFQPQLHDVKSTSLSMGKGFDSSSTSRKEESNRRKVTNSNISNLNWCALPDGQNLPTTSGEVSLLDTNLPTLKDRATNPTGAVAVVQAPSNSQYYCFSSNCPSCKIPLTKAKVLPPLDMTNVLDKTLVPEVASQGPRLICDFCQAPYSLKDGTRLPSAAIADVKSSPNSNFLGSILKNVMSAQSDASMPLRMYRLGESSNGKLLIVVD